VSVLDYLTFRLFATLCLIFITHHNIHVCIVYISAWLAINVDDTKSIPNHNHYTVGVNSTNRGGMEFENFENSEIKIFELLAFL